MYTLSRIKHGIGMILKVERFAFIQNLSQTNMAFSHIFGNLIPLRLIYQVFARTLYI